MAGGTLGEVAGRYGEDDGPAPASRRFARSSFTLLEVLSGRRKYQRHSSYGYTGGDSQPPEPEDDDELVVDVARDGLKGLMRFRL